MWMMKLRIVIRGVDNGGPQRVGGIYDKEAGCTACVSADIVLNLEADKRRISEILEVVNQEGWQVR